MKLKLKMTAPENSNYKGKEFSVILEFPISYPSDAPKA